MPTFLLFTKIANSLSTTKTIDSTAIEVESEVDKPFVISLRNKFPDKWKEKYRDLVKDLAVYNLTISTIEETPTPTPTVRARRINKKDEDRYKRLLG